MQKRKYMIMCFLAFCLTATLFIGVTTSVDQNGIRDYDPWCDVNDDGIIDIVDLVNLGIRFGEEGTPINKTELLLDLQDRVEALETGGFVGAPAYDSGWVFSDGSSITRNHNLGTDRVFVYLIGRNSPSEPISGDMFSGGQQTMSWGGLNTTHISFSGRYGCKYVRVMIWKIQPAP